MSYMLSGWLWLIIGGLAVGIGSVVSTLGWNWQGKKEKKRHTVWWLLIIAGLMLAGLGAVFSTWGWDNINKKGQRDALLFALGREWHYNQACLTTNPLRLKMNGNDNGEKISPYRQFQTTVVKEVMISDVVSDPILNTLLIEYFQYADNCNSTFAFLNNDYLSGKLTLQNRRKREIVIRTKFQPLQEFIELHQKLKQILNERYPKEYESSTVN